MSYVIKDYALKVMNHYVEDTLLLENFPFWKFPFVKCVLESSEIVHTLNSRNNSGISLLITRQMLGIQRILAPFLEVSIWLDVV